MRTPGVSLHPRPAALWRAIRPPSLTVGPWGRGAYDPAFADVQIWMRDLAGQTVSRSRRDLGGALAGVDQAAAVQRA